MKDYSIKAALRAAKITEPIIPTGTILEAYWGEGRDGPMTGPPIDIGGMAFDDIHEVVEYRGHVLRSIIVSRDDEIILDGRSHPYAGCVGWFVRSPDGRQNCGEHA